MNDIFSQLSKDFKPTESQDLAESSPAPEKKDKILVVDDNVDLLSEVSRQLGKHYEVITCSNPFKVMEILDSKFVSVVLDIRMDGKNGFEVCREINQQYDIPVIFFTAFQNEKSFLDIINEFRPFGYLQKGCSPDTLLKKVQQSVRFFYRKEKEHSEKSLDLKRIFLANVSHDLRTDIHVINGISDSLKITAEIQGMNYVQENLSILQASSTRMLQLINNLLDHSKLEAGKLAPADMAFSLKQLLAAIKHTVSSMMLSKNLEFKVSSKLSHDSFVSDPQLLSQILANLITVAIKFAEGQCIQLKASEDKTCLIFEIIYQGDELILDDDISEFNKSHILDKQHGSKFNQLGLAICHRLVKALKGNLTSGSLNERESVTAVRIPKKLPKEAVNPSITIDKDIDFKEYNILICDDDDLGQEYIKLMMEDVIQFQLFSNGFDLLNYLKESKKKTDAVFLDINMPGINGFETLKKLKEMKLSVPVIALTAFSIKEESEEILSAGFSGILTKPYTQNQFFDYLKSLFK